MHAPDCFYRELLKGSKCSSAPHFALLAWLGINIAALIQSHNQRAEARSSLHIRTTQSARHVMAVQQKAQQAYLTHNRVPCQKGISKTSSYICSCIAEHLLGNCMPLFMRLCAAAFACAMQSASHLDILRRLHRSYSVQPDFQSARWTGLTIRLATVTSGVRKSSSQA